MSEKPITDWEFLKGKEVRLDNTVRLVFGDDVGVQQDDLSWSFTAKPKQSVPKAVSSLQRDIDKDDDIFIKLPNPKFLSLSDEVENPHGIRDRFFQESQKGDLINHVADRCLQDATTDERSFLVPHYVGYATIQGFEDGAPEIFPAYATLDKGLRRGYFRSE